MGSKGSGPKTRYNNEFHNTLRARVKESRAHRKDLIRQLSILDLTARRENRTPPYTLEWSPNIQREQLPRDFSSIVNELRAFYEFFTPRIVERTIKMYASQSVKNLESMKSLWDFQKRKQFNQTLLQIYNGRAEAEKDLEHEFPQHVTDGMHRDPKTAGDLWINGMKFLHSKGHKYYESELACNTLAFPIGAGDINDPYQYLPQREDGKPIFGIEHLLDPKFRYQKEIAAWRIEEAKETAYKTAIMVQHARESKDQEIFMNKMHEKIRPFLVTHIKRGFTLKSVLAKCRQARYSKELMKDVKETWFTLRRQGIKPQIIKMQLSDEEPEPSLDDRWLACMAGHSGKPGLDGRINKTDDFANAQSRCTWGVFKGTGKRPSDATFNKAKKYWEPGYWATHDIIQEAKGINPENEDLAIQIALLIQQGVSDDKIVTGIGYQFDTGEIDLFELIRNIRKILANVGVQKKERAIAYSQMATTVQNLTDACVRLFGSGWTYDVDTQACVKPKEKPHNLQNAQELAQRIPSLLWKGDYDVLEELRKRVRTDLTEKQLLWFIRKIRKEYGAEPDQDYHADRKGSRSLRGTIKHTEPETQLGDSVVSKVTQKGTSVTKERKKVTRIKIP